MKKPRIRLSAAAWAMIVWLWSVSAGAQTPRSAQRITPDESAEAAGFDRSESAGLFVGVRHFTHDEELADVRYAVDDAIDLAFAFSLERNSRLVNAPRVVLALSGEPEKAESQQKLDALLAAGATIRPAGQTDILSVLEQQARSVGPEGAFVVTIATHGFNADGEPRVLAANSLFAYRETSIPTNKIRDIIGRSQASHSLLLLDACRRRLITGSRSEDADDPRTPAPLVRALAHSRGEAVLYAAAAGEYAYDDEQRKNGVFTAAVLDALHCGAATDAEGLVTVDTLASFVDTRVRTWIRQHRNPNATKGIQILTDASSRSMPLAACDKPQRVPAGSHQKVAPRAQPATVRTTDNILNVFDIENVRLWGREVDGKIVRAEVADLDGDGVREVIAGVGGTGTDVGKILVFDADGKKLWSTDTSGADHYGSGYSGRMSIMTFATGDLFRKGTRQIVSLSIDAQGWYPSRICIIESDGAIRSSYWHPGHLHKIVIGAATAASDPRIVVAGLNNDLRGVLRVAGYVPIVFVLDPRTVGGEAPPYFGGGSAGTQLWYGFILPPAQNVDRLELVDRDRDGTQEICVWMSSRNILYLDFAGNVIGAARGDGATGALSFGLASK